MEKMRGGNCQSNMGHIQEKKKKETHHAEVMWTICILVQSLGHKNLYHWDIKTCITGT